MLKELPLFYLNSFTFSCDFFFPNNGGKVQYCKGASPPFLIIFRAYTDAKNPPPPPPLFFSKVPYDYISMSSDRVQNNRPAFHLPVKLLPHQAVYPQCSESCWIWDQLISLETACAPLCPLVLNTRFCLSSTC